MSLTDDSRKQLVAKDVPLSRVGKLKNLFQVGRPIPVEEIPGGPPVAVITNDPKRVIRPPVSQYPVNRPVGAGGSPVGVTVEELTISGSRPVPVPAPKSQPTPASPQVTRRYGNPNYVPASGPPTGPLSSSPLTQPTALPPSYPLAPSAQLPSTNKASNSSEPQAADIPPATPTPSSITASVVTSSSPLPNDAEPSNQTPQYSVAGVRNARKPGPGAVRPKPTGAKPATGGAAAPETPTPEASNALVGTIVTAKPVAISGSSSLENLNSSAAGGAFNPIVPRSESASSLPQLRSSTLLVDPLKTPTPELGSGEDLGSATPRANSTSDLTSSTTPAPKSAEEAAKELQTRFLKPDAQSQAAGAGGKENEQNALNSMFEKNRHGSFMSANDATALRASTAGEASAADAAKEEENSEESSSEAAYEPQSEEGGREGDESGANGSMDDLQNNWQEEEEGSDDDAIGQRIRRAPHAAGGGNKQRSIANFTPKPEQLSALDNGEFHYQAPGLLPMEVEEAAASEPFPAPTLVHKHSKLKFSVQPLNVYTTYSADEYDRKARFTILLTVAHSTTLSPVFSFSFSERGHRPAGRVCRVRARETYRKDGGVRARARQGRRGPRHFDRRCAPTRCDSFQLSLERNRMHTVSVSVK